jgi:hypothetical protein
VALKSPQAQNSVPNVGKNCKTTLSPSLLRPGLPFSPAQVFYG